MSSNNGYLAVFSADMALEHYPDDDSADGIEAAVAATLAVIPGLDEAASTAARMAVYGAAAASSRAAFVAKYGDPFGCEAETEPSANANAIHTVGISVRAAA